MLARVAMPAVRQKRSKLAPTSCQAASTIAAGTMAADVVASFMALLSFVDSAPRAYRLKVGNACPPISTSTGTSPLGVEPITRADIEARIARDNPWWADPQVSLQERDFPKRVYFAPFKTLAFNFQV